jgi:hypothetical protein
MHFAEVEENCSFLIGVDEEHILPGVRRINVLDMYADLK